MSGSDFDEKWQTFEEIFNKVADIASQHRVIQTNISTIMVKAYNIVYNQICANPKHATLIYNKSQKLLEGYLNSLMNKTLTDRNTQQLLRQLSELWSQYDIVSKCCAHMLKYVNQHLEHFEVENTTKEDTVPKMLVHCFKTTVYDTVKENLRDVMFEEIAKEREGIMCERSTLRDLTAMIATMGAGDAEVYEQDFEKPYLDVTTKHYNTLATQWLQTGVDTFLHNAEKWLAHERSLAQAILNTDSVDKVDACLNREVLERHYIKVVDDEIGGAKSLLMAWNPYKLGRMYKLLKRIAGPGWTGLDPMAEEMQKHILLEGTQINTLFSSDESGGEPASATSAPPDNQEPPPKRRCTSFQGGSKEREADYIRDAIELHDKYTSLFVTELENHKIFTNALRRAFETFFNAELPIPNTDQTTNGAELLSNFCDTMMSRKKIETNLEHQQLNKLVMLFTYLSEKDTFREFYHKAMARRLLARSSDVNVERDMITLLKQKMQGGFVKKLEDMLQDRRVADDAIETFKSWCKDEGALKRNVDFSVFVLTRGSWPKLHLLELKPPSEFAECMETFTKYYTGRHEKRTLIWVHSYGKATLQVKYPKVAKAVTVNCNTMQACVLLLFNYRDSWTLEEIAVELGQPKNNYTEVKTALVPLLFSKYKLLAKATSGKEITMDDNITVNEKFESQQVNIHVPSAKTTDRKEVQKQVEENRKFVIDCYLVKIGKATRMTSRLEMETKCIQALSQLFQPDPSQIRMRIESLIQREFLSVVTDDKGEATDKVQYCT